MASPVDRRHAALVAGRRPYRRGRAHDVGRRRGPVAGGRVGAVVHGRRSGRGGGRADRGRRLRYGGAPPGLSAPRGVGGHPLRHPPQGPDPGGPPPPPRAPPPRTPPPPPPPPRT